MSESDVDGDPLVVPPPDRDALRRARQVLAGAGFRATVVRDLLGADGALLVAPDSTALLLGRLARRPSSPAAVLARLFLLEAPAARSEVVGTLGESALAVLDAAGLLHVGPDGNGRPGSGWSRTRWPAGTCWWPPTRARRSGAPTSCRACRRRRTRWPS